ncbi:MAG: hypothetical protein KDM63_12375 [Verrucomicrobiae bacterium]|nr:hypothetical protein [Verrucomicrobiae bacterium]
MKLWIQRHDFSSEEIDGITVESVLERLRNTDWQAESRLAAEKAAEGVEVCPAGLGLVHPSGSILHLCPDGSGGMMLHYQYPITPDGQLRHSVIYSIVSE